MNMIGRGEHLTITLLLGIYVVSRPIFLLHCKVSFVAIQADHIVPHRCMNQVEFPAFHYTFKSTCSDHIVTLKNCWQIEGCIAHYNSIAFENKMLTLRREKIDSLLKYTRKGKTSNPPRTVVSKKGAERLSQMQTLLPASVRQDKQ